MINGAWVSTSTRYPGSCLMVEVKVASNIHRLKRGFISIRWLRVEDLFPSSWDYDFKRVSIYLLIFRDNLIENQGQRFCVIEKESVMAPIHYWFWVIGIIHIELSVVMWLDCPIIACLPYNSYDFNYCSAAFINFYMIYMLLWTIFAWWLLWCVLLTLLSGYNLIDYRVFILLCCLRLHIRPWLISIFACLTNNEITYLLKIAFFKTILSF